MAKQGKKMIDEQSAVSESDGDDHADNHNKKHAEVAISDMN